MKKKEKALLKRLQNLKGRDIVILSSGGVGDQVDFEPVVRFLLETSCKNDLIRIVTAYGEIYKHLNVETYDTQNPCLAIETTLVLEPYPVGKITPMDYQSSHFTDFASVNLLRRTLPLEYKRPKFPLAQSSVNKIEKLIPSFDKLVVIHPGKTWQSRTIPSHIWQSYLDALKSAGYKTCLIGKNFDVITIEGPQHKIFKGAVKLQADYDLIDKLSFYDSCALLAKAPIMISNDSAPMHMAFAYDNWIGCIATARHPDYLFSWRNKQQYWQAEALEEHQIYLNEYVYDPLIQTGKDTASLAEEIVLKACPSAEKIVNFVRKAIG